MKQNKPRNRKEHVLVSFHIGAIKQIAIYLLEIFYEIKQEQTVIKSCLQGN